MRFSPIFSICVILYLLGGVAMVRATDSGNLHASRVAYPDAVITVTDSRSGITVSVDPDGARLTAKDKAGKVLWHANVVEQLGPPNEGRPVIRHVSIGAAGNVSIVLGKNRYVEADLKTGKIRLLGED